MAARHHHQLQKTSSAERTARLLRSEKGLAWRRLFLSKAKLKEARGTSFILAAFSMSTMTELQLDLDTTVPMWLFTLFAVNTVVLITVHIFSLVISTCLLPTMEAVSQEYEVPSTDDMSMRGVPPCSPHDKLRKLVSLSVTLSSVIGLLLFLFEVALLAWIKFWDHARSACWAGSLVIAPFLIFFILFCWYFHKTLNDHVYRIRKEEIHEMQSGLHIEDEVSMTPSVSIP